MPDSIVRDAALGEAAPFSARVQALRRRFDELGVDALLVSHLPNIQYLTGLAVSAGLLLVTRRELYLIIDFRYAAAVERHLDAAGLCGVVIPRVAEESLEEQLTAIVRERREARVGVEAAHLTLEQHAAITARLKAADRQGTDGNSPGTELVATSRAVESLRVRKDAWELALLREAARRLSEVAEEVIRAVIRVGRSEEDIAAEIDWRMRRAGFSRPAFDTIVASGPNSAMPHAQPTARRLEDDEPVLLDFGGVYGGYCVDLTRTVCLGTLSPAVVRLHAAVADAQRAAIAAVRPGVAPEDVDATARAVLARYELADAFGHSTGHGLGLEVHEAPRLGRPRDGQPSPLLEAGMVCTIEPGVYVSGVGGVRIEDDVVVTADGCEVLTRVDRDWRVGASSS